MRVRSLGVATAIGIAIGTLILFASVAYATWDWSGTSINSGYAVTTDWHGELVPLGEEVTAWAGTTDYSIVEVKFRWLRPDGTQAWIDVETEYTEEWWADLHVHEFSATRTPDEEGDWGVQAVFYGPNGNGKGPIPDQPEKVAIRARSFFVIPEVAIGTVAVIVAMFGALGLFALKRKHVSIKEHL